MPVHIVNYGRSTLFKSSIYLDTNLLICAINQTSHKYTQAASLLGDLFAQNITLSITHLVIDEYLWALLRAHYRNDTGSPLDPQLLKQNPTIISKYYHIISTPLITLLGKSNLSIVSDNGLTRDITDEALKLMKNELLMPRDAFHLAFIIKLNIPGVVTSDPDFDNLKIPYYNLTIYKY